MFGFMDRKKACKRNAYTMAEMLIVMVIIAVVILSLPRATKKLFKVEAVRTEHARFECYWKTVNGEKKLYQYSVYESLEGEAKNARETEAESQYACVFTPPDNTPYVIMHAVGGGGGGVDVHPTLSDVETYTALSYFNKTASDLWPSWFGSSGIQNLTYVKNKTYYETDAVYNRQLLRYRHGGSPGSLKSMFFPNLPAGVKLLLIPGKGGNVGTSVSQTESNNGGNGDRTLIRLLYPNGNLDSCITSENDNCDNGCCNLIIANGGAGGDAHTLDASGNSIPIDTKQSVMLTGGKPSDYGLSEYGAVKEKGSGFAYILTNDSDKDALKTKVDANAGNGGRGANQFLDDAKGKLLYEVNDYQELLQGGYVQGANWTNVTSHVSINSYSNGNCTASTLSGSAGTCNGTAAAADNSLCATRVGYCDYEKDMCYVGKVAFNYSTFKFSCMDNTNCAAYKLVGEALTPSSGATTRYANCKYNAADNQINCYEKLTTGSIHNCTKTSVSTDNLRCSNGLSPVGSGRNMVCPASAGGDGAVVILW